MLGLAWVSSNKVLQSLYVMLIVVVKAPRLSASSSAFLLISAAIVRQAALVNTDGATWES